MNRFLARLFRFAALHTPKPIDLMMAASYGIVECLGAPRYFHDLLLPAIKSGFSNLISPGGSRAKTNKRTA